METDSKSSVTRFTSLYDMVEDRIKFSVELSDGKIQVLWLTRRLLNRMLLHLIKILDQSTQAVASAGDVSKSGEVVRQSQAKALHRFSQEAAVSAIERQPAVGAGGEKPEGNLSYVVTSVDVHTSPSKMVLDFKGGEKVLQSVPFGENTLRQWLNVLHAQYRAGEWQEPFWPSWIGADGNEKATKGDLRLN